MPPVVTADKCTGCGRCVRTCKIEPNVFTMVDEKSTVTNAEGCNLCGACENGCEFGAVVVVEDE